MTGPLHTDESIVVIGGGTMGVGIAQSMLEAGASVLLVESDPRRIQAARDRVEAGLRRRFQTDPDPVASCDKLLVYLDVSDRMVASSLPTMVIEAVPEDRDLKAAVLREVELVFGDVPLIATNTSSLSIGGLAACLTRPARFLGMHFFNPVARSELVELVVGPRTASATLHSARVWVERLNKKCIVVNDSPGFATSRLGVSIGLEAIRMLQEGVASAEDIDLGMTLGYKFPVGPLRLTDIVGLDVRLMIAEHLANELGPRFEPPQLLRDLVAAGHLGQKTGKGFFEW
jgi:3-hydroxybutyryl-CoA dehydrogenase